MVAWINTVLRDPETGKPFVLLPGRVAFLETRIPSSIAVQRRISGTDLLRDRRIEAKRPSQQSLTLVIVLLFGGNDPRVSSRRTISSSPSTRVFSAIKKGIVKASPKAPQEHSR